MRALRRGAVRSLEEIAIAIDDERGAVAEVGRAVEHLAEVGADGIGAAPGPFDVSPEREQLVRVCLDPARVSPRLAHQLSRMTDQRKAEFLNSLPGRDPACGRWSAAGSSVSLINVRAGGHACGGRAGDPS